MLAALLWATLLGCGQGSGGEEAATCESLAGLERDTCLADRLRALPGPELAQVQAIALQIQDGMVRQAAILRWTKDNAGQIPREAGREMCHALLQDLSRGKCERYIDAVHLNEQRPVGPGKVPRPD